MTDEPTQLLFGLLLLVVLAIGVPTACQIPAEWVGHYEAQYLIASTDNAEFLRHGRNGATVHLQTHACATEFSMEISESGVINGRGKIKYRYDGDASGNQGSGGCRLVGDYQVRDWEFKGSITPQGEISISGIPEKKLKMNNMGRVEEIKTWSVLPPPASTVMRGPFSLKLSPLAGGVPAIKIEEELELGDLLVPRVHYQGLILKRTSSQQPSCEVSQLPSPDSVERAAAPSPSIAYSMGTAFAIGDRVLVTNFHVVANSSLIEVQYPNGTRATASILAKDPPNDLAILQLAAQATPLAPLPVGDVRKVRDGQQVFTVGFPLPTELGVHAKVSEGIVNSVTGMGDDPRMYQISIPVQPGNSGGPLVNGMGQVVGVVTSGLNNKYLLVAKGVLSQNVNFAMKINYINNLIAVLPDELKLVAGAEQGKALNAEQVMDQVKGSIVIIICTVPAGQ